MKKVIRFYNADRFVDLNVPLPVCIEKEFTVGIQLQALERWLRESLHFELNLALLIAPEYYSPLMPLTMINSLDTNILFVTGVEKRMHSILHGTAVRRNDGAGLVDRMVQFGFAKVYIGNESKQKIQNFYENKNFDTCEWKDTVDGVHQRYVGVGRDKHRKWIQMRKPKDWPPTDMNKQYSMDLLEIFTILDTIAVSCFRAICQQFNINADYFMQQKSNNYGSSVLRVYQYSAGTHDTACGAVRFKTIFQVII